MKKIGLVGGTGPESTLMYYKELNSRIDSLTAGKAMPEIVIESLDFRRAWNYVVEERFEDLSDYIAEKINSLAKSGAEVISLTAVTMHMIFDSLKDKTGVELVSIPETVAEEAVKRGYKRVGLIGTALTMERDYMKKALRDVGIEAFVPGKSERALIAKRILEELELGIVKESTLAEFNAIIGKMKEEQGIEGMILGCTELPLLLNDDNCVLPCLDSVKIHIEKLIAEAT